MAVIVIIKEKAACAHRLGETLGAKGVIDVDKINTRRPRPVSERNNGFSREGRLYAQTENDGNREKKRRGAAAGKAIRE
jgi:hypothetical protein